MLMQIQNVQVCDAREDDNRNHCPVNKNLTVIGWVVLAILTLAIALSVKFWSDSNKLKDAIDYGYRKRINETSEDSLYKLNQTKFDSINVELQSVKDTLDKIRKR